MGTDCYHVESTQQAQPDDLLFQENCGEGRNELKDGHNLSLVARCLDGNAKGDLAVQVILLINEVVVGTQLGFECLDTLRVEESRVGFVDGKEGSKFANVLGKAFNSDGKGHDG